MRKTAKEILADAWELMGWWQCEVSHGDKAGWMLHPTVQALGLQMESLAFALLTGSEVDDATRQIASSVEALRIWLCEAAGCDPERGHGGRDDDSPARDPWTHGLRQLASRMARETERERDRCPSGVTLHPPCWLPEIRPGMLDLRGGK